MSRDKGVRACTSATQFTDSLLTFSYSHDSYKINSKSGVYSRNCLRLSLKILGGLYSQKPGSKIVELLVQTRELTVNNLCGTINILRSGTFYKLHALVTL